mmetsp:Transcript_16895/g.39022  ORF Transcript_16895/g.39022 Transcript_16895/m.39022 type:complete len:399 (-) Transcript_16895:233-1429(-)
MPERISWMDTNLALIGSELDRKVKEAAAQGEEAWEGIGQEAGLAVWRVEQFTIQPWPKDRHGQFYKGDSYIVLRSSGKDPDNLKHDIFIWIGSESTADEYGTAAYKMVEADDYLGGAAVQHRQVEGYEADEFVDCFNHLEYLEGGISSGFNRVEPTKEKPMFFRFRPRGNGKGELVQVPIAVSSMESTSGFILCVDKANVWVWHGQEMKIFDKVACTHKAEELCTLGVVTVLAQGDGDEEDSDFWNYLEGGDGGSNDDSKQRRITSSRGIGSGSSGYKERKNMVSALKDFKPKLFKVEADPTTPLTKVGLGTLVKKVTMSTMGGLFKKDCSDDRDVFLLDSGWEIFVWIGKSADCIEKVAAMGAADRYAKMEPRAKGLPVTIIKAGQEKLGGFWSFFK